MVLGRTSAISVEPFGTTCILKSVLLHFICSFLDRIWMEWNAITTFICFLLFHLWQLAAVNIFSFTMTRCLCRYSLDCCFHIMRSKLQTKTEIPIKPSGAEQSSIQKLRINENCETKAKYKHLIKTFIQNPIHLAGKKKKKILTLQSSFSFWFFSSTWIGWRCYSIVDPLLLVLNLLRCWIQIKDLTAEQSLKAKWRHCETEWADGKTWTRTFRLLYHLQLFAAGEEQDIKRPRQ